MINASFVCTKCDKEVSIKPSLFQHVKMIHKTGIHKKEFECKHFAGEVEELVDFSNYGKKSLVNCVLNVRSVCS